MARAIRFGLLVPAALLLLISAACDSPSQPHGGGPDPDTAKPQQPPEPPQSEGVLECEIQGYPCSLSEVPLEILERSDALGDEVAAMLRGGAAAADAAAWLKEQENMAEVDWDGLAIRFRLEGGRPVWVLREGAFATGSAPGSSALATTPGSPSQTVVAEDSKQKRALLLSPFFWEFPTLEDVAHVAAILADTRGYQDGVSLLANEEQASTTVNLGSFGGWQDYQVIHISTHGRRLCNEAGCRATIAVGLLDNLLPDGPTKATQIQALPAFGLAVQKRENGPDYLILEADFFRQHYPAGLDDAVVFINACQSFGPEATDLVEALRGKNTVVFGWDEAVFVVDATATALALYQNLARRGYPAVVAYEELGSLQTGDITSHSPNAPRLRMRTRHGGGDVRIRDNIYLLNPRTGSILNKSHRVVIEGAMGDGQNDAAPFRVFVDGVKPEFAGGMSVHVTIDGAASGPVPLTAGEYKDDGRWEVEGLVQLPYDLTDERVAMFRASVNLHDDGESQHETLATLTGNEPIMGWKWTFEAEYETHLTTFIDGAPSGGVTRQWARAELVLSFREDQDLAEPNPTYLLTEGTVNGDFSSTHTFSLGTCYRNYGPFTFTIDDPPDWVPFHAFLNFHTEFDPVRYSGTIRVFAPILDGTINCGDGPEPDTYAPHATYMSHEPQEELTVSEDRMTITGSWSEDVTTVLNDRAYRVRYHRSTYTITRIE